MNFVQRQPRKRHDCRDGIPVKDISSLNMITANLFPRRADNEMYQKSNVAELLAYIQLKNTLNPL